MDFLRKHWLIIIALFFMAAFFVMFERISVLWQYQEPKQWHFVGDDVSSADIPLSPGWVANTTPRSLEHFIQIERDYYLCTLQNIQAALEKFYTDKKEYPKSLPELEQVYPFMTDICRFGENPRFIMDERDFEHAYNYAYFPTENPIKYHIGGGLKPDTVISIVAENGPANFNSLRAGYTNGFDGTSFFYDLVGEEGGK